MNYDGRVSAGTAGEGDVSSARLPRTQRGKGGELILVNRRVKGKRDRTNGTGASMRDCERGRKKIKPAFSEIVGCFRLNTPVRESPPEGSFERGLRFEKNAARRPPIENLPEEGVRPVFRYC